MGVAAALTIGYLLGSISPAWILGRLTRHIDIRNRDLGTTGTSAAFRLLGPAPGLLALLFNLGKGLLAMYLANVLGLSPLFVLAAGGAALVGHVLPFYLRFQGGQGITVASTVLVVTLLFVTRDHPIPWHLNALLAVTVVIILFVTRGLELLGLTAIPLLVFILLRHIPPSTLLWYAIGICGFMLISSTIVVIRSRSLAPDENTRQRIKLWRFLARPAAMAFPALLFFVGRTFTLILLGGVTLAFTAMEITRLSARRVNIFLLRRVTGTFKQGEQHRVSSMTGFLIASLLVTLIFDRTIAVYAMAFLVFGDFFAKYFGLRYGRTPLFSKSLEGSLSHLLACLVAGLVLNEFVPMPLWVVGTGALTATVFEVLPVNVDDNLTVGITSAAVLHFARMVSK